MKYQQKKDRFLPGLRVTSEMFERKRRAMAKLHIDVPSFCRALVEDFIKMTESGEKPAMPPHILTAREERILQECMEVKIKGNN